MMRRRNLEKSAPPSPARSRTISRWPFSDATINAVPPLSALAFTSALASSSARTTSWCPPRDAIINAVTPVPALRVYIGLGIEQQPCHLLVAILRRHHQRRAAITGFGVYIGLGIEQRPYHLLVPIIRRHYQRRAAVTCRGVHIGLGGEQGTHHLLVTLLRRHYQRRDAIGSPWRSHQPRRRGAPALPHVDPPVTLGATL